MADPFPAFEQFHPFTRLARLLAGIAPPAGTDPLILSIGEPQGTPPAFVADMLARHAADWGRYPPAHGTPDFRRAVRDWLNRRYRLPDALLDPDRHILPVAGSREALYMLAQNAVARSTRAKPVVLLPNPFYHVYAGAIAATGAEPHFLPATRANGFMPAPEAIDRDMLARTALAFVCSPSNPQGAIASRGYLENWIRLARDHDFTVLFDECYSEVYRAPSVAGAPSGPPAGALEAVATTGTDLEHVVVVHSLSKRSGAPGLRSGFIAGDGELIARQMQLVNYGGVAVPLPILAASAALWRDERHVEANRARYDAIFAAAGRALGGRFGYMPPPGAFFAWLEVGDDEAAAKELWAKAGIKVLPGRYMGREGSDGRNPGAGFVRVALVHEPAVVADAMTRLADVLDGNARQHLAGDAA